MALGRGGSRGSNNVLQSVTLWLCFLPLSSSFVRPSVYDGKNANRKLSLISCQAERFCGRRKLLP